MGNLFSSPSRSSKQDFLLACRHNDLQEVQLILSNGGDVNWRTAEGRGFSGLHIAANNNSGELLQLLLVQTGVDVNIRDNLDYTPIMLAFAKGHENIVKRLCQVTGIHLNSRNGGGCTALHLAVAYNRPGCVSVLREVAGVDWNVRDDDGWYPVTLAAILGRADCLKIILSP